MCACLLALLMLLCLPMQWADAAAGALCVHEPCAVIHANLANDQAPADADDHIGQPDAQHTHCGSCHTGVLAMLASTPFVLSNATADLQSEPSLWTEVLLIERPERPQWSTLA